MQRDGDSIALAYGLYATPCYADYLLGAGVDAAVSVFSSYTLMRGLRAFDAAVFSVRLAPVVWSLGAVTLGIEGAAKGQLRRWVRYRFGDESTRATISFLDWQDMEYDAGSNILAHTLFSSFDFRTAISARAAYPAGRIDVFYLKFPAQFRHMNRWSWWRGFIIPYKGRASGGGSPAAVAAHRAATHHWNPFGFGPHIVLAASDFPEAINYLERLLIQYLGPAAHITGPAGFQRVEGIHTAAATAMLPVFMDEFVWWHVRYAAQHLQTPAEVLIDGTAPYINGVVSWGRQAIAARG